MPQHHRPLLLAALALVALLTGCKKDPDPGGDGGADAARVAATAPLRLGEVKLRYDAINDQVKVPTEAELGEHIKAAMLAEPEFVPLKEEGNGPFVLRGLYRAGIEDPRDGSGQLVGAIFVDLTLSQPRATPPLLATYRAEAFVGESLPGKAAPNEELPPLVKRIAAEAGLNLVKQVRVHRANDDDLLAMLDPKADPELLGFAINAVRQRKLEAAATPLATLLSHPERDIVNLAAAALGDVGSPAQVPALIDAGSRVPPLDRLPVLYALGELGGPEAELYLSTLVDHTDHPQIKAAAESALLRARRKKDGGGLTTGDIVANLAEDIASCTPRTP